MKVSQLLLSIIFVFLSGCKNPLDEAGMGSSTIQDGYNALLSAPSTFRFSGYDMQSSQVVLRWDSSERAESYQVKYGTVSGNYTVIASCSTSPCTITGLTNSTTYYFTATASNTRGSTPVASELSVTLLDTPSIPTGLATTPGNGSVTLTWSASTGAGSIKYKVLRSSTSGSGYSVLATNLTSTTYTDTAVVNGSSYYYVVRSFNQFGEGTNSSEIMGAPMGAPSAPTGLSAIGGLSQISLSWTASAGLGTKTYSVLRSTTSGSGYTQIATNLSATNYTDSAASVGTTYYYVVTATNLAGTSANSSQVSGNATQNFSLNIPFSTGTSSSYIFSDSSAADISGNVLRLSAADQTDDDNTSGGFGGATATGTQYDTTNQVLRLNTTTNTSELNASWTPKWSNLAGYWKLNGTVGSVSSGATIQDSISGGGNNATLSATSTYAVGKMNQALTIDGTLYADTPATTNFDGTSKLSFSFWYKPTTLDNSPRGLLCKRVSNTTANSFCIFVWTNNKIFVDLNGTSNRFSSSTGLSTGVWSHIVVVYDGTISTNYRAKIFINGNLDTIATSSFTSIGSNPSSGLRIGGMQGNNSVYGLIDDVAIWQGEALSRAEVKAIYDRQVGSYSGEIASRIMDGKASQSWTSLTALTTLPFFKPLLSSASQESTSSSVGYSGLTSTLANGLIGLWHLDDLGSGTIVDSSGSGNNGTAYNLISTNDCSATGIASDCMGANGVFSKAANFIATDATAQYIDIPNSSSLLNIQSNNATYSIWFNARALPLNTGSSTAAAALFVKPGYNFGYKLATNGRVYFDFYDSSNVYSGINVGPVSLNKWNHAVVVFNYTTGFVYMYLNGALVSTMNKGTSYVPKSNYSASATFKIGAALPCAGSTTYCYPFNGLIDEAAVWNRPLSSAEILELYRRGGNRIKYQVRTCTAADCSEASKTAANNYGWQGSDGTSTTYFTELTNSTINNFTSSLSLTAGQYFQYKAVLESDDESSQCNYGSGAASCSPELKSLVVGPVHYSKSNPYVTNKTTIGTSFVALSSFASTLGSNSCTGDKYTVSADGTSFWYYSAGGWAVSDGSYTQTSTASQINSNIGSLVALMGAGTLQVRTYLNSDGVTACEVDNILVQGQKY